MFGLIAAGLAGAALGSSSKRSAPEAPEKMSYDEAYRQAENALGASYQENRKNTLSDIQKNLISRGFYGQSAGDYVTQDAMTDMASDYESQKSRYAQNLRNSNYAEDYQAYNTELQQYNQPDPFWNTVGTIAGGWVGSPTGSSTIANWLMG